MSTASLDVCYRIGRWLLAGMLATAAAQAFAAQVFFQSAKFDAADPDVKVSGELYLPGGPGPHAAVILLHTCGGQTQHVTHDWPRFLVELGYVVLGVDTLGSRGYYRNCAPMQRRLFSQARDAYGALDYLAGQSFVDARRVAAMGFSMGAVTINNYIMTSPARSGEKAEFRAFASFYGRCRDMKPGAVREIPLLQIIAEKDEQHAPSCIEKAKSIKMEADVLPGAYHAFDSPENAQLRTDPFGSRMLYDAAATEKARALVRAFLEASLK